ncbi:peptidase M4 [Peribacillus kribbensis]|uniref:peptidase M4 n=1 Tax=Peribacillus kribbensis TaxID=356658 RepID=UPI00040E5007|nr:peptidase M4 [Peribacillus kribbensis]
MNWKTFGAGLGAGFAAGFVLWRALDQKSEASPEKVLNHVKSLLKTDGRIQGSWILMKPEMYEKYDLPYKVYRGGITKNTNGRQESFEFIADAKTAGIIELIAR